MTSPPKSSDGSWVTESSDSPRIPAEIVFILVVLTLSLIFSLAGVPGTAQPVVSDGSDALRMGWLEQHNQTHAAALPAEPGRELESGIPGQPGGR